jgi:hypothetical protein
LVNLAREKIPVREEEKGRVELVVAADEEEVEAVVAAEEEEEVVVAEEAEEKVVVTEVIMTCFECVRIF